MVCRLSSFICSTPACARFSCFSAREPIAAPTDSHRGSSCCSKSAEAVAAFAGVLVLDSSSICSSSCRSCARSAVISLRAAEPSGISRSFPITATFFASNSARAISLARWAPYSDVLLSSIRDSSARTLRPEWLPVSRISNNRGILPAAFFFERRSDSSMRIFAASATSNIARATPPVQTPSLVSSFIRVLPLACGQQQASPCASVLSLAIIGWAG